MNSYQPDYAAQIVQAAMASLSDVPGFKVWYGDVNSIELASTLKVDEAVVSVLDSEVDLVEQRGVDNELTIRIEACGKLAPHVGPPTFAQMTAITNRLSEVRGRMKEVRRAMEHAAREGAPSETLVSKVRTAGASAAVSYQQGLWRVDSEFLVNYRRGR